MNNPFVNYIVAILMFTLFIMGGVSILAIMQMSNADFIDSSELNAINNSVNVYSSVLNRTGNLQASLKPDTSNFGLLGAVGSIISTMYNTLMLMLSSFGFVNDALNAVTTILMIPAWVTALIIAMITVVLIFTIIYFITGRMFQ